jgi:hypothetical protein
LALVGPRFTAFSTLFLRSPAEPVSLRPSDAIVYANMFAHLHGAAAFKLRERYADRNLERGVCG